LLEQPLLGLDRVELVDCASAAPQAAAAATTRSLLALVTIALAQNTRAAITAAGYRASSL
jgi:hypothetical protein